LYRALHIYEWQLVKSAKKVGMSVLFQEESVCYRVKLEKKKLKFILPICWV
jgi:hypothetical protein